MTGIKTLYLTFTFIAGALHFSYGQQNPARFTSMKPQKTHLKFTNKVREDDSLHVLIYEYLYNGHGICVGDFNQDGLEDVFISGNTTPNKLFINKGEFRFEDITREAGVQGRLLIPSGCMDFFPPVPPGHGLSSH